ncbi:MAG TPA: ADP-ribosylglycohydrolase family protein, partial [Herpetosiphonaceae bacterium]
LGDLWQQPGVERPEDWIARGWDECQAALERTAAALPAADPAQDPCALAGAGWVAEESLAAALLCFLAFPAEPLRAVRWAVVSSGDSDSIASLAGALAGAALGLAAWPAAWLERIEYRERLAALADGLAD